MDAIHAREIVIAGEQVIGPVHAMSALVVTDRERRTVAWNRDVNFAEKA